MCYATLILVYHVNTFFCCSEKEVYLVMQVCGAGNQEIRLGIGYCQEHILVDLQIIFLSSLSYAPSITPWFSLVLVRPPPAIPLVHNAFYKTHLFTVNSDNQKTIC